MSYSFNPNSIKFPGTDKTPKPAIELISGDRPFFDEGFTNDYMLNAQKKQTNQSYSSYQNSKQWNKYIPNESSSHSNSGNSDRPKKDWKPNKTDSHSKNPNQPIQSKPNKFDKQPSKYSQNRSNDQVQQQRSNYSGQKKQVDPKDPGQPTTDFNAPRGSNDPRKPPKSTFNSRPYKPPSNQSSPANTKSESNKQNHQSQQRKSQKQVEGSQSSPNMKSYKTDSKQPAHSILDALGLGSKK